MPDINQNADRWLCPAGLHQCEAIERCRYPGNARSKDEAAYRCPGPITAARTALEANHGRS